jgi:predicted nuclease of predicted toxin-antitoxin system
MTLAYLIDEHLRGPLWTAIQRHNAKSNQAIDAIRVGDTGAPPLGTDDPEILKWAEANGRVLVTLDESTMPGHLGDHLRGGRQSPGVFTIRTDVKIQEIVEYLMLAAHASDPAEWMNRVSYLP